MIAPERGEMRPAAAASPIRCLPASFPFPDLWGSSRNAHFPIPSDRPFTVDPGARRHIPGGLPMSFAYLPLFTGDYRRDTAHLTPLKHGIYLLLLMHCWDQKGPVPLDEQESAGICNCRSADEIESLRYVLGKYFTRCEDGWYNQRMQSEIERSENISRARSQAGRAGYEARSKQLPRKRQAIAGKNQAFAKQVHLSPSPSPDYPQTSNPSLFPSHSVDPVPGPASPGPAAPVAKLVEMWNDIVARAGGQKVLNVSSERRKRIARRWAEVGPDSLQEGLDWFEHLFRDRIAASKFATGRQPGRDGRVFRIGIDSALGSEQVVDQILEGKYVS
jgi:uncharacterized protein YdaU (DUF1376 family)